METTLEPTKIPEQILQIVERDGPLIPIRVTSQLRSLSLTLAGAYLSELASEGKIKITSTKSGSSPFYYTESIKERLVQLRTYLNEKDREAFDLLQREQILRDTALTPLLRVSLRGLRDFAIPLTVTTNDGSELFWKWYLVAEEEAKLLLAEKFFPKSSTQKKGEKPPKPKQEGQEKLTPLTLHSSTSLSSSSSLPGEEVLREYTQKNAITLSELTKGSSKSILVARLLVPTPVGTVSMHTHFVTKKSITEQDIASLILDAQIHKLPALLLTTGALTKKAQLALTTKFKDMVQLHTISHHGRSS